MQTEELNGKVLETWTPAEVENGLRKKEIVLIDVRTAPEYMFESVEGALLAPLSHLASASLPAGLGKHVVLYCGSGIRSRKAAELCMGGGYRKIAHMEGGFANWKNSGLPYLGTNMATGGPEQKVQQAAA